MTQEVRAIGRVLLVEDNPAERRLALEAFKMTLPDVEVYMVEDGVEALTFLYGDGKYQDTPLPHLIILDLNLPKKDGRQVLAELKEDINLRQIPIVVLTSSQADEDITDCYRLHANCYITKPVDLESFFSVIKDIEQFWLADVRLPPLEAMFSRHREREIRAS